MSSLIYGRLECGHAPSSVDGDGKPVCTVCFYRTKKYDLTGRQAQCTYCKKPADSSPALAFFEFHGEGSPRSLTQCKNCNGHWVRHQKVNPSTGRAGDLFGKCDTFEHHGAFDFDNYYCGCRGWD